jgi:hypothetical protein
LALTQSLQVAVEVAARPEDLFDTNPIVMAEKLGNDEDFVQNLAYMTNESFWMAGIARHFGAGRLKAFAYAGMLAVTDSIAMNLLIKGEANPVRIAADTAWESIVGNLQTTVVDSSSLRFFEGLSIRRNNPKLVLIGYAIAVTNQAAGYFAYAKFTQAIEKNGSGTSKQDDTKSLSPGKQNQDVAPQGDEIQNQQILLIPVLAEAS